MVNVHDSGLVAVLLWSMLMRGFSVRTSAQRKRVGVVIRDHWGTCLAACSELLDDVVQPEVAKASALRRLEVGFSNVIFQSDCLSRIRRVLFLKWIKKKFKRKSGSNLIGMVVQDIKCQVSSRSSVVFVMSVLVMSFILRTSLIRMISKIEE